MRILFTSALALLCLLGCCALCETPGDPPPVILDCDMGDWNDDALTLSLLMKAEEAGQLRILGITLEGGNSFINADYENYGETQASALRNTENFLARVGREDIPVYCGTDYPQGFDTDSVGTLSDFYENLRYLKDSDSYGAVHFYRNLSDGALTDTNDARDFLLACAEKYPGRVTVIAIGPTMNLARAVRADASFAENIAAVYYMAGAFDTPYESAYADGESVQAVGGANITPFAEYNACYDALSLKACLTAGFPKQYIVPGEISVPIDDSVVARLKSAKRGQIAEAWLERWETALPDYPYWDPVTAAAFLCPENLSAEERYVTVRTDRNDPRYAMTSSLTEDEYALLGSDEQAQYGKAFVASDYADFWDFALDLLCQ